MKIIKVDFENDFGCGYIEITKWNQYGRNDSYEVIVEDTYKFYSEEDVINSVESTIYKYL